MCHPACKKEYGCWGPGPDQCVRCSYRRAGLYTCVQSCSNLTGYMSEQWEKQLQMSNKKNDYFGNSLTKNFHLNYHTAETEYVCVPCHPECGKSCTGPGAHECIGSCKTAWVSLTQQLPIPKISPSSFDHHTVNILRLQ